MSITCGAIEVKLESATGVLLAILALNILIVTSDLMTAAGLPVHNIDTGRDYAAVQGAIDAPETLDGHTIKVDAGIYHEHLNISKSLILQGEDNKTTIIDGDGTRTVVMVTAPNVEISGFKIRGSSGPAGAFLSGSGILLLEDYCVVSENVITNNYYGVVVRSEGNVIANNTIESGREFIYPDSPTGILLTTPPDLPLPALYRHEYRGNNIVRGNIISNISMGISLWDGGNNTLDGNTIFNNTYGIAFRKESDDVLIDNMIYGNEGGIVMRSSNVTLRLNKVRDNGWGIFIDETNGEGHYTLRDNGLDDNTYNFGVNASRLSGFIHDIDTSNLINGKPIYYLTGRNNLTIDPSTFPEVGYLAVVNSMRITVKNLVLKNNLEGVLVAFTENSTFKNLHVSDNKVGIILLSSNNNSIIGNTIMSNDEGISLLRSHNNFITRNNLIDSPISFIVDRWSNSIYHSFSNTIHHNNFIFEPPKFTSEKRSWYDSLPLGGELVDAYTRDHTSVWIYEVNTWDNGYPLGGNYWIITNALDSHNGPNQDETGSDGIVDEAYVISELSKYWPAHGGELYLYRNQDKYPLMNPCETPPSASAGPSQTVDEDTVMTLNGSASWDNTNITNYTWTFNDEELQTRTGVNPNYSFTTPGVYTVTLNVSDPLGQWNVDTTVITVLDVTKPEADAGPDRTVIEGAPVSFDASGSDDNVGIVSYEWDFGDGTTATGLNVSHNFANPGTYTVTLTVKDAQGNIGVDSLNATVLSPWWLAGIATIVFILVSSTVIVLRKKRQKGEEVRQID